MGNAIITRRGGGNGGEKFSSPFITNYSGNHPYSYKVNLSASTGSNSGGGTKTLRAYRNENKISEVNCVGALVEFSTNGAEITTYVPYGETIILNPSPISTVSLEITTYDERWAVEAKLKSSDAGTTYGWADDFRIVIFDLVNY